MTASLRKISSGLTPCEKKTVKTHIKLDFIVGILVSLLSWKIGKGYGLEILGVDRMEPEISLNINSEMLRKLSTNQRL